MKKKTQKELFNILYRLEDIYDYDNTKLGKEIGELVNKLQTELLNKDTVYPFKEGDDYYTIEDNKIVWSCWDNISEEFYRDDPNRLLFETKEQAQEYINKLNK